jgi:hypothetical protein
LAKDDLKFYGIQGIHQEILGKRIFELIVKNHMANLEFLNKK